MLKTLSLIFLKGRSSIRSKLNSSHPVLSNFLFSSDICFALILSWSTLKHQLLVSGSIVNWRVFLLSPLEWYVYQWLHNATLFGIKANSDVIKVRIFERRSPRIRVSHKFNDGWLFKKNRETQGRRPYEDGGSAPYETPNLHLFSLLPAVILVCSFMLQL